jgi:N-acetylmuramoyl-L-alanine amidase
MRKIDTIVVHFAATYPDQHVTAATITKWHKARGFRTIGYHWFIRRDGMLEEGRPESEIGAHVAGHNARSIGICWAGGIDKATGENVGVNNMTPAQEERLIWIIRQCLARYPGARVIGHRDLAPTECPGFDVASWWAKVNAAKPAPTPQPENPWLAFLRWLGNLFTRRQQ